MERHWPGRGVDRHRTGSPLTVTDLAALRAAEADARARAFWLSVGVAAPAHRKAAYAAAHAEWQAAKAALDAATGAA